MAAVIGRSFYHRVLEAVDEASPGLDKRLGTLLRLDMIREAARKPEVEYTFRNPLTQEAVYQTILLKRRRAFHPRLEALALRDSHQLYLGIAHRAWGVAHCLADEHDKAAERLTQALGLFHDLGTRWQTGRTRFEMGELNLAKGEKDRARNHFSFALEAFETMKAMPDVERTRVKLETII